jgi:hypothetical protein
MRKSKGSFVSISDSHAIEPKINTEVAPHEKRCFIIARNNFARPSRSVFVITDTELKLIAAAAMMGESSKPKTG